MFHIIFYSSISSFIGGLKWVKVLWYHFIIFVIANKKLILKSYTLNRLTLIINFFFQRLRPKLHYGLKFQPDRIAIMVRDYSTFGYGIGSGFFQWQQWSLQIYNYRIKRIEMQADPISITIKELESKIGFSFGPLSRPNFLVPVFNWKI